MAWSGAASGSKANPGGSSGSASGQSSGSAGGGPSGGYQRAGNVNQQGSNQARQGALGTTKAQVAAGVFGQRINSPLSNPFSRAAAMAGGYRDRAHMKRVSGSPAAVAAGGIAGMAAGRKSRGDAGAAGGPKAVIGRLQSHQSHEIESH